MLKYHVMMHWDLFRKMVISKDSVSDAPKEVYPILLIEDASIVKIIK